MSDPLINADSAPEGVEEAQSPPSASTQDVSVDADENAEAGLAKAATGQHSEGHCTEEETPAGSNGDLGDTMVAERTFVGFGNGTEADADAVSTSQNDAVGAAASASTASESPSGASVAPQKSSLPISDLTKSLGKLPGTAGISESISSSADGTSDKPRNPFVGAAEAAGRAWRERGGLVGAREGLVRLTNGGWRAPPNPPAASSFIPQQQPHESTDAENKAMLEHLQQQTSSPSERVSFSALAKGRDLAQAARMEFNFGTSPKDKGGAAGPLASVNDLPPPLISHDLEVGRHRAVTADVEADAQAESDINKEMIALVVERLQAAQKSVEAYGKMFTGMAAAETAYAKAMEAVAREAMRPIITTEPNSGLQEGSSSAILQLPSLVSKAHGGVRMSLKEDANALYDLDQKIRESLGVLRADAAHLNKAIQGARHDLQKALHTHEGACGAVDALMLGSGNGRAAERVEKDPWITETLLAKAHAHLRDCLQEERSSMDAAYGRLQELELERSALMARLSLGCFEHYKAAAVTVHDRAVDLAGAVEGVDSQGEVQRLMSAAKQASDTSRDLAARQAENLETVATDLFCSPEILRQGPMEIWNSDDMRWMEQHFVLTRSGFLHWFESTEHLLPSDFMNLSRCHIAAGEPPIFNLLEDGHGLWFAGGTRERKVTLKAEDVDDCCEWVIGIREEIASKTVK